MNSVRHDSYTRGALRRSSEAVSGLHFLLMFVAAGLLVLTRVDHPLVTGLQSTGRQVVEPVLARAAEFAQPMRNFAYNVRRYFVVESEFRRLERELVALRQLLNQTSSLATRNQELAQLANLVRASSVSAVTVEVIAGSKGLFAKSVQIGAGSKDGLGYGQPVFSSDGLFGRLVSLGEETASVLVLNDLNSRIPVVVGKAQVPALLVGDNTDYPRLIYLSPDADVREGALVVTSGASGEFPRGIKVGKMIGTRDAPRVATDASLLPGTYLTVLRYALPTVAEDREQGDTAKRGSRLQVGTDLVSKSTQERGK